MPNKTYKAGRNLAIFSLMVAVVVVLLGAFTRLADAGLGCPDWPTCYGHLWVPNTAAEIELANQKFIDTPVETHKTWPEQIHRIFASSLGLLIIGLVIVAHKNRAIVNQPIKHTYLLLLLVIVQGLFGMWTVTLKLWPQVVTAHLLGGFFTLALLWLLLQRLSNYQWSLPKSNQFNLEKIKGLSHYALLVLVAVVAQIALGGWTSSNYAALACPDIPLCQNQWLPPADFSQGFDIFQSIGPNYLGGLLDNQARTAIHLSHRVGAVIVSVLVLVLCYRLWLLNSTASKRWSFILLAVLCIQISLGLSNVFFALPLSTAVAHNGVGAGLLLVLVTINHRLWVLSSSAEFVSLKNSEATIIRTAQ